MRDSGPCVLGMTRYQWTVFAAAWLGWGFDVFDGLLFNFVAPICVPALLGTPHGEPISTAHITTITDTVTAALLVGWATRGSFLPIASVAPWRC